MNKNKNKQNWLSALDPNNRSTYIYNTEDAYYEQYNNSYFAYTCKKGGWDCMRHYEIIAAGCLPVFKDFDMCPKYVLTTWPTLLQYDANIFYYTVMCNNQVIEEDKYDLLLNKFYDYAFEYLKTTDIVKYIFSKI